MPNNDDKTIKDYFLNISIVTRIIINLGVINKTKIRKLKLKLVPHLKFSPIENAFWGSPIWRV